MLSVSAAACQPSLRVISSTVQHYGPALIVSLSGIQIIVWENEKMDGVERGRERERERFQERERREIIEQNSCLSDWRSLLLKSASIILTYKFSS